MKLICLPHAGGAGYIFQPWTRLLSRSIELIPVEYSGRGKRFGSPFWTTMNEAVADVYHQVASHVENEEYVIFGHSMGCVIAFELAHMLMDKCKKSPNRLVFSGRRPPHSRSNTGFIHKLNDHEFLQEIIKLGGIPDELVKNEEMLSVYLHILKADFHILEEYSYFVKPQKLCCDFAVFYGANDTKTNEETLAEWSYLTTGKTKLYMFRGNHFFIQEHMEDVVQTINELLAV